MQLVEAHPEELLSDKTIELLAKARDGAGAMERALIEQHITALQRCREVGIARAFEEAPAIASHPPRLKLRDVSIDLGHVNVPPDVDSLDRVRKATAMVDLIGGLNEPELARKARIESGQAYLSENGNDRAANLRAALQTFEEILSDGMAAIDMSEVWLGIGAAHFELAALEHNDDHLKKAVEAYRKALDKSPVRTVPERARMAGVRPPRLRLFVP